MNEALADIVLTPDQITALDSLDTKIPLAKLLELRLKPLSYSQIGAIVGCSAQNVWERLQHVVGYADHMQAVKDGQADMLAISRARMLEVLMVRDHSKTATRDLSVAYGVQTDKEQLLRGKATMNVAYADVTRPLPALIAEAEGLKAELGMVIDVEVEDTPWTVDTDDSEAGDPQT